jgi:hypothetical protein
MFRSSPVRETTALISFAALALAACVSPAPVPPAPSPIDMQRGWRVYVYAAGGALVGVTTMPQHPADQAPPDAILADIAEAFCRPALDKDNAAADEGLRDFCQPSPNPRRVVLAPGWNDDVPAHKGCFIHCVCEGRAPRTGDAAEQARASDTGPCTNRLNCRLDCPQ